MDNPNVEVKDFMVFHSSNYESQKDSRITIVDTKRALSSLSQKTFSKLAGRRFTKKLENHSIKYPIVSGRSESPEIMFNENELIIKNKDDKKFIDVLKNTLHESCIELEFDNETCLVIPNSTCIHARSDFRTDYLMYGFNAFIPRSIFDQLDMTINQNK